MTERQEPRSCHWQLFRHCRGTSTARALSLIALDVYPDNECKAGPALLHGAGPTMAATRSCHGNQEP